MKPLYEMPLDDALSVAGAGHRVRALAEKLGFAAARATRLGLAVRELANRLDSDARFEIALDCDAEPVHLCLRFQGGGTAGAQRVAAEFFESANRTDGSLTASIPLPDPAFRPDESWLERASLWLGQQTASELRAELVRKNEALQEALSRLDKRARVEQQKNRELEAANEELEELRAREYKLARFDSLTGLPARILFSDRLEQALRLARRHEKRLAVLFVDLDYFKELNDSFGHAAGDAALREIGQRMAASVRASDTVARLGGDEFAVILQEIRRAEDAVLVAEKLLSKIGQPVHLEQGEHRLGASIGIAVFPDSAESADELVERADEAMYAVKRHGRNGYEIAEMPGTAQ